MGSGRLQQGKRFKVIMKKTIMLVASSGGHWVQLTRILPALDDYEKVFVTTDPKYRSTVGTHRFLLVPDASRWNKLQVVWLALITLKHVLIVQPDVVVSTGAAPGFFAILFGKKLGAKTIWIDSIANVDELSMSGRMVGKHADLWLTQWKHLATDNGPKYAGEVL